MRKISNLKKILSDPMPILLLASLGIIVLKLTLDKISIDGSTEEPEETPGNNERARAYTRAENNLNTPTSQRFQAFTPHDPYSAEELTPLQQLDISRLEKTHIKDVLSGKYSKSHTTLLAQGCLTTPISEIVKKCHRQVGALTFDKGLPFGSGVLVAPNLFLTARHCIEGKNVSHLNIRFQHQVEFSKQLGDDFLVMSENYKVSCIAESSDTLDFAILELEKPNPNFAPHLLNFSENPPLGSSALIHHPDGGPKMVSVHGNLSSGKYLSVGVHGYYDSSRGSSGAPYISAKGVIFALHIAFDGNHTNALKLSEIMHESIMLKGKAGAANQCSMFVQAPLYHQATFLPELFLRKTLCYLERVGLPRDSGFPSTKRGMARHHIIPIGQMEFLWLLGQENKNLKEIIKSLALSERQEIEYLAWAPWNLFTGPDDRFDDPTKDGAGRSMNLAALEQKIERRRPQSFPNSLWDSVKDLGRQIKICWNFRKEFQNRHKEAPIDIAVLDNFESMAGIDCRHRLTMLERPSAKIYGNSIADLLIALQNVKKYAKDIIQPHEYHSEDWDQNHDQKNFVKYS